MPVGDRCTGECCKHFYLPWSHDDLADWYARGASLDNKLGDVDVTGPDNGLIVAMIRPVPSPTKHHYTCTFFDGNQCTNYENRPSMCVDFPYGRPCEHGKLCAWDLGRRGEHRRARPMRVHLPLAP